MSSKIVGGGGGAGGGGGLVSGTASAGRSGGGVGGPLVSIGAAFGEAGTAREGSVACTLKVTWHPRQRIVLPANDSFIRNVRLHAGQLRASWPSITQGMARGGSDSSAIEAAPSGVNGTRVVSCGT
jgi:hypothetical protein